MIEKVLNELIFYGLERGLIEKDDEIWARNTLMGLLSFPIGGKRRKLLNIGSFMRFWRI